MTEQETQPATCGECCLKSCLPGGCSCPQPVLLCPLHAQAKALLEALEPLAAFFPTLPDHYEQFQGPSKILFARFHIANGTGVEVALKIDHITAARAAIAAAQPKHAAQEGED